MLNTTLNITESPDRVTTVNTTASVNITVPPPGGEVDLTAVIAGSVVGGVVLLAIIIGAIVFGVIMFR